MPREGHPFYNMRAAPGVPPRWHVVLWYRSDDGLFDVEHMVDEIDMVHGIVERGPDWHTLDRIEIRLSMNKTPNLTVEASRQK